MNTDVQEFIQSQRVLGQAQLTHFDPTDAEHQEHLNRYMFAASNLKAPCRVLDIACGIGYGSRHLADSAPGIKVTGVDISDQAVEYAISNFSNDNVKYQAGDGTALPFADESFDYVVSFETIEHVPRYEEFLSELRRVLKPGGTIVMSTPNREFTNPLGTVESKPPSTHHIHEWRIHEFKLLFNRFFEGASWYSQMPVMRPLAQKAFIVARRPLAAVVPALRTAWIKWHRCNDYGAGATEEGMAELRRRYAIAGWDDRHPGRIIVAVGQRKD